jgi:hypothetical protein
VCGWSGIHEHKNLNARSVRFQVPKVGTVVDSKRI